MDPVAACPGHVFRPQRGAELGLLRHAGLKQADGLKIDIQGLQPLQIVPGHLLYPQLGGHKVVHAGQRVIQLEDVGAAAHGGVGFAAVPRPARNAVRGPLWL